jgi:adenylyltransferase/sulfurtransferase
MESQISPKALAERMRKEPLPLLLDVREIEEHNFAALPNSKLIPLSEFQNRIEELGSWRNSEIVVYCHHGIRSLHAIAQLSSAGFSNLCNLSGGIDAWSREVDASIPRY